VKTIILIAVVALVIVGGGVYLATQKVELDSVKEKTAAKERPISAVAQIEEFENAKREIDYWVKDRGEIGIDHYERLSQALDSAARTSGDPGEVSLYKERLLSIRPEAEKVALPVSLAPAPTPPPAGGPPSQPPPLSTPTPPRQSSGQATPAVPKAIDETGLGLTLPAGYKISYFTKTNLGPLRFMTFSPDGILFVTKPTNSSLYSNNTQGGEILAFPDANKDGIADETKRVITGLTNRPHGIAFYDGYLYIAEENKVSRYKYLQNGNVGGREYVVDLPTGNDHVSRTVGFSPSGKMYVSVGSSCNVCIESKRENAAILEFNIDGSGQNVFADGLRNAVGFVFHPTTQEMWVSENGRDWLGDNLPPDEINIVRRGSHYGWPYCYGKNVVDPKHNDQSFCSASRRTTKPSTWDMQAHSAALGLRFIEGAQFADWDGDLLVAFHGSWNRSIPTGYKVVRLKVSGNTITAEEDFITGWLKWGLASGRPVDVIFDKDGALYLSDDKLGVIYKIMKIKETAKSGTLLLTSSAFLNQGRIPTKYTCDGSPPAGGVSPPLQISGVPAEAKSLALIFDDPDAVGVVGYVWDHWILFNIDPATTLIPEGQAVGIQGTGTSGNTQYEGSCPPKGRDHAYSFRLYALDQMLSLSKGATKKDVVEAMTPHILEQTELIGRYSR